MYKNKQYNKKDNKYDKCIVIYYNQIKQREHT